MSTIAAVMPTRLDTEAKRYSLREYLLKEERSKYKHEFHNGQIIKSKSLNFRHNEIAANIGSALKIATKSLSKKYRVISSDQKIFIPQVSKILYADALVICEEPELWEDREDLLLNPLIIVEVASKSTRNYDKGEKFMHYRHIPSFMEYILVEQDEPLIESWFRAKPKTWEVTEATDLKQSLLLQSIGVSIALEDVYENIDFIKK